MTTQVTRLQLRDTDKSGYLKNVRFKLSREDKQILSEEAKKFKGLEITSQQLQSFQVLGRTLIESQEIWESMFPAAIPDEVSDYAIFDRNDILLIESCWFEESRDTRAPIFDIPSRRSREPSELEVFERERQTFLRIRDSLLTNPEYRGKFVAIHRGGIVDQDEDIRELARRVYDRFGYVQIYMDKIERERRIIEMPSPEVL